MSQNTPSLTTAPHTTAPEASARKAILNIAAAGRFSSDRRIAEYARELWQVKPCRVEAP